MGRGPEDPRGSLGDPGGECIRLSLDVGNGESHALPLVQRGHDDVVAVVLRPVLRADTLVDESMHGPERVALGGAFGVSHGDEPVIGDEGQIGDDLPFVKNDGALGFGNASNEMPRVENGDGAPMQ